MTHQLLNKKEDIIAWLDKYRINNYELIKDLHYGFMVNVHEEVNLMNQGLDYLPVKFNIVEGNFFCLRNKLTCLYGAPERVKGTFNCSENQITTLDYLPKEIVGSIAFSNNKVTSLKGLPNAVNGNLFFANNELNSLKYCSDFVLWSFLCTNNQLKSLEHGPRVVKKIYLAGENRLETIEYLPQEAEGMVLIKNPLLGELQSVRDLEVLKAISQKNKLEHSIGVSKIVFKINKI